MAAFSVLICLSLLFRDIFFGSNSIFSYVLSGNWVRSWNVFSLTSVLLTVCVVSTIVMAISTLLSVTEKSLGPKGETISRLTRNFLKYFVIIGLIYYSLAAFGVDVNALVTSAGILTLVIGLGARDLISDILAGLFIVFEGEFQVGDIVTVGDWRGTVQEIGVRTTKIMDAGGNVKIFSNSAVSGVINMTRRHSFCVVDVGIEYGESLERVEAVLARELPLMAKKYDAIREGPFYKGVVSLSDSAVILRIIAKCDEGDRVQLTRDLTRAVKLVFDANDINIPFPQVVVNQPPEFRKATIKEKKAAERYINKEKEASTDFATIDNDGNS